MTLSEHFDDQPFPTLDFVSRSHVNMWLRALDKRDLIFHFEDDPYDIVHGINPQRRTFTDKQAECITRCVKRFRELLGDSCDMFQYASAWGGGGWALPVHDLEPEDLAGATIKRYVPSIEADNRDEVWPQFEIILANGEKAWLTCARDPELNGPGHALIERDN
jgi:hypothetical protein